MRGFFAGPGLSLAISFGCSVLLASASIAMADASIGSGEPAYIHTASLVPEPSTCTAPDAAMCDRGDTATIAEPVVATPPLPAAATAEDQDSDQFAAAVESCRPWRLCSGIEETIDFASPAADRPAPAVAPTPSVAALDGVAEIVDRMVLSERARSTPQSPFVIRSLGYRVPKGNIVILTSERKLLYFFQDWIAMEFAIGVARRGLQRKGQTHVSLKRRDPIWVPTALQHRVYRNLPSSVGPGPKNPLGTRALNLTIPNIRIHGTNDDKSIGEAMSDGCFHMYNRDIEFLFEHVAVGAKVAILN